MTVIENGQQNKKKRVLSGMRPTGRLHIGHLVGALQNWVKLQHEYECYHFIADWHMLTTDYMSTSELDDNRFQMILDWLACGLDAGRSTLFVQSAIKEHAELHLLLSMITPLGWLERVPSYKEMRENLADKDLNTYGFLGYPLLQSADILMYKADFVPVGEDQVPHVELTREIARRFNFAYGQNGVKPIFPEPQALLTPVPRLPGTDGRKMSKSLGNDIKLSDDPGIVEKKILPMVTDPARKRRQDPGNPDLCPVFDYHKAFSTEETKAWAAHGCRTAEIGCIDCKRGLLKHLLPVLEPIAAKRRELEANPGSVREILENGNKTARRVAQATMDEVRRTMLL
ncbi:MAG: tryptophan--tRNA ligase [Terriglobia bacterium]